MDLIKFQRTIGNESSCVGIGLHTGVETKITFKPAPEDFGIRFKRMDIEGSPEIRADIDHVVDISRGTTIEENGVKTEPYEHVTVDVEQEYQGTIIEKLGQRGAEMTSMETAADGMTRIEFMCPTRGLIGYTSEFLTDTRGTGTLNHVFHE